MTKRRTILLVTGAAALLAVACRDALAPTATPRMDPFASQPQLLRSSGANSSLAGSITLTPQGGDYLLGGFLLHVPAGAVCDPSTTTYGPGFWNDECTPLSAPLRLQVQVSAQNGRLWIDFKPNVRFTPSEDPSDWVTLSTRRRRGELVSAYRSGRIRQYALLYAPEIGATPVDEAATDRSLVTVVQLRDGTIWRRLKHFSGFTISLGRACDPAVDQNCTSTTGGDVDVQPSTQQAEPQILP